MQTTNMKGYMKPVMRSKVMPTQAGGASGSTGADLASGAGDLRSITVQNAMRRMPQGAGGAPGGGVPRPDIKSAIGSLNQQLGMPDGAAVGPQAPGSPASVGGPLPKRYANMDPATAAQRYSMFKQGQLPGQQGMGATSTQINPGGPNGPNIGPTPDLEMKSFPMPPPGMETLDFKMPGGPNPGGSAPFVAQQLGGPGGGPPSAPFFPGQPSGPNIGPGPGGMAPGGGGPRPFVGQYNPYLQLLRQQMGGGQGAAALGAMA